MGLRAAIGLGLLFIMIDGCGYLPATPSVSEGGTPAQGIVIPVFLNDTFEPALEGKVTRMVKQEFLTHGGFRIVQDTSEARLILEGRITSFGLTPLSFNPQNRVGEYRVSISMEVKLLAARDKKLLWQQEGLETSAEFVVSPDPGISRSVQDLAIDEASKRIAEEIWFKVSRLNLSGLDKNTDLVLPPQAQGVERNEPLRVNENP
jgi:hypothetical protein